MPETRTRDREAALAIAGGAGLASYPTLASRRHRRVVSRRMDRAVGSLGGLTEQGVPVDPATLKRRRGKARADGSLRPGPRAAAISRYEHAKAGYLEQLARGPMRPGTARALRLGGAGLAAGGVLMLASDHGRRIAKAASPDLLEGWVPPQFLSPQLGIGIPATRMNPISPLTMLSSASIMSDAYASMMGVRLTRSQRKAAANRTYRLAMARGQLYSPLGMGVRQA